MELINPLEVFGSELNSVQVPSRYIGGEFGVTIKEHKTNDSLYNFAVAFPDLYEIAMSNLAVKIIYNGLNKLTNVRCERVFAPSVDFEELLKQKNIPLYTLETGIPLYNTDMIGFSIGYELGITEVLAMLENGKVPVFTCDRKEKDPIVICGGCGVTNPAPFSDFFDAFIIGEAEPVLFNLVSELASMKKKGTSRDEMISFIESKSFIWTKRKCTGNNKKIARRSVQNNFGLVPSIPSWFPLPSSRPVQDHGVIEIMRGCPNGCRFCHAGIYYRPTRVKNLNLIIDEIDKLVFEAGYREISLNSLSSADFPNVDELLDTLNERYKGFNVSFQLPSLKVNSLSLDILKKLSTVRKSGLTFAVETPLEMWQLSLNKEVYAQHLEEIILEAKKQGWSSAKFYFMIGLPLGDYFSKEKLPPGSDGTEEKAIVDFLIPLQNKTKIQCNVNIGVFIPKPHTAYERMKQITVEEAKKKIDYIYENLPKGKFKIGRHNFNANILEGLLSRGDERAGKVIYSAYKKGARFDAWDEYLRENFPKWQQAFNEANYDVLNTIYKEWTFEEELPWHGVSLGPSSTFYKKEWEKSLNSTLTSKCTSKCDHKCGICNTAEKVEVYTQEKIDSISSSIQNKTIIQPEVVPECNIEVLYRVIFNFKRINGGEWTAYLSQVEIFHKAILRSALRFVFTSGFNPLPRLEFASAMTLGVPSFEETASCLLYENIDSETFINSMNKVLPKNLQITEAFIFPVTNLRKRESLTTGLWGALYSYNFFEKSIEDSFFTSSIYLDFIEHNPQVKIVKEDIVFVQIPASDKKLRQAIEEFSQDKWYKIIEVKKLKTLAKPEISGWTADDEDKWRHDNKNFTKSKIEAKNTEPISFMELYKQIAKINIELIEKRKELTKEQVKFYEEHPDIKNQRTEKTHNQKKE